MSCPTYIGTANRTFKQAVIHLLENGYALVGSGRISQLLAKDIEALVEQFYPAPENLRSGWMVFTGTKAEGRKAYPGKPASAYKLVTIAWPVCLQQDLETLATMPTGDAGKETRRLLLQHRAMRLVEHGWQHSSGPVLLTLSDLSVMLGHSTVEISQLLADAREKTGKPLPTMGHYFDQGQKPSHKAEIVALYEQGLDEAAIAYRSQHAQGSVGRYLRDYERVKLSLQRRIAPEQIALLTGLQPAVVKAYVILAKKYHSDLFSETESALKRA
jgi:hypothetical protein